MKSSSMPGPPYGHTPAVVPPPSKSAAAVFNDLFPPLAVSGSTATAAPSLSDIASIHRPRPPPPSSSSSAAAVPTLPSHASHPPGPSRSPSSTTLATGLAPSMPSQGYASYQQQQQPTYQHQQQEMSSYAPTYVTEDTFDHTPYPQQHVTQTLPTQPQQQQPQYPPGVIPPPRSIRTNDGTRAAAPPAASASAAPRVPIRPPPNLPLPPTLVPQHDADRANAKPSALTSSDPPPPPAPAAAATEPSASAPSQEGRLDQYAEVYVPEWIKNVNREAYFHFFANNPMQEHIAMEMDMRFKAAFWPPALDPFSDLFHQPLPSSTDNDNDDDTKTETGAQQKHLQKLDVSWLRGNGSSASADNGVDASRADAIADDLDGSPLEAEGGESKDDLDFNSYTIDGYDPNLDDPSGSLARDHPLPVSHHASQDRQRYEQEQQEQSQRKEALCSPGTYQARWTQLLDMELQYRAAELGQQALYAAQVFRSSPTMPAPALSHPHPHAHPLSHNAAANFQKHLYYVKVPGIRQDKPYLAIHDRLHIRPIRREPILNQHWAFQVYEAHITAVHRLSGTITFSCDPVAGGDFARFVHDATFLFNIEFLPAQRPMQDAKHSLAVLGQIFKQGDRCPRARLLRKWLFPTAFALQAGDRESMTREQQEAMHPEVAKLNPEQAATAQFLATHAPSVPFLISGPPGTGKTRTLVGTTLAILRHQPDAHILLCAPSNTAADTLALRLKEHLGPDALFRMNHPTRSFTEMPQSLTPYCCVEKQAGVTAYGLPPWLSLMQKRVVVTATFDVPLLISANCSNLHLSYLYEHFQKGMRGHVPTRKKRSLTTSATLKKTASSDNRGDEEEKDGVRDVPLHWTHLLVDEAGQGTEAEITSALVCMLPWRPTPTNQPVIALCGDVRQLGPQIRAPHCRKMGLDSSLLDRLSELPLYASALQSIVKQLKQHRPPTSKVTPCGQLIRNYRATHPMLLMLPSILFYNDILLPLSKKPCRFNLQNELPNPQIPLWFENIEGDDVSLDDGISWYNGDEVRRIVDICTLLTARRHETAEATPVATPRSAAQGWPVCQPSDIAVISPFNEQVWQIRIALRRCGLGEISVGPVEAFQGAEHPISIVSTVRSQAKHVAKDINDGIGIIHERKRLCVAISRAQEMLIVVGNLNLLFAQDAIWRQLLTIAARNQCLRGVPLHALRTKEQQEQHMGPISRLEMAMHEAGHVFSDEERDDQTHEKASTGHSPVTSSHPSSDAARTEKDTDGQGSRRAALVAARSAAIALMD